MSLDTMFSFLLLLVVVVAALKAYRQLDTEWVEYSPRKAADVLELAPQDYEVDEEYSALLLRRLPPGLPESTRDVL